MRGRECTNPRGLTVFAVRLLGCALAVTGLLASAPAVAGVSGADCIEQVPDIGSITCTANDVRIGTLEVVGDPVTCDPTPVMCAGGANDGLACTVDGDCPDGTCIPEQVTVDLKATIISGPERYDIGLWLNETGGSAQDDPNGTCYRDILTPPGEYPTDTTFDCDSVSGPYANGDNDSCGDIPKDADECANTVQLGTTPGSDVVTEYLFTASVACTDGDTLDGVVEAGACTSWSQNPDEIVCNAVLDAIPGSPAKCECNPVPISGLFSGCKTDEECDDGVGCTTDVCTIVGSVGTCSNTPVDSACDDGNVCTLDTCDAVDDCSYANNGTLPQCNLGNCVPLACDDIGNECTEGACNPDGTCAPPVAVADSTPCEDGDVCTSETGAAGTPDHCEAGVCVGIDVDCSGEDDQCNVGVCNAGTGVCEPDPIADSTPCQDGDVCTSETGAAGTPDHCEAGVCVGIDVDCSGEDDQCNVGVCNAGTGVCEPDPIADSTPCQDGDVCTSETGAAGTPDHCEAGVCVGIDVDCSGEDDQCNVGVCNAGTGVCEPDPIADSTPCQDGDVCTSETGAAGTPDHCEAGVCVGIDVDCSGEDDQCNVGVCNAGTGVCEPDPIADSTPCQDGDVCTSETGAAGTPDHCEVGVCVGIDVDCSGEDDQCNVGVCNAGTGVCEPDPIADSTPCQDGDVCTSETGAAGTPDHCEAGVCVGIDVDCSGEDDQCNVGVCNAGTGVCEPDPIADSTPCQDGDVCTSETGAAGTPDHCEAGVCVGIDVDCSGEDDQCNVGVCNAGTGVCEPDPIADSTPCQDGDVCTSETGAAGTPDHCEAGVCVGIDVDCSGEDDQCNVGVCNAGTGVCEPDPIADSTPCQDGDVCTSETGAAGTPDHCEAGVCVGINVNCSGASDQCNVGVCNAGTGVCEPNPIADSTPCQDGDVCTSETGAAGTPDHCEAGVCVGIDVDCSGEDDQCNVGVCNAGTGVCEPDPIADSTPCQDGDVCTSETGAAGTPDHCEAGVCVGIDVDCSGEDDQCNVGVCNAGTGVCEPDPIADSTPCEDGDFCTSETGVAQTPDHCEAGVCVGIDVDCSGEDDQCNTGVCDVATGACEADPLPDSTPCQDGLYCTSETGDQGTPDHCETGSCTGVPVECPEPTSQCNSGATCDEDNDTCDNGTYDPALCKDPCSGDGKQLPPTELEFLYVNTAGDTSFDEVCIIVTHHRGDVWTLPNVTDYFSFSRAKKLNPKIEIEICSDETCTDTSTCAEPIKIHTSCSLPLNIGDLFGPNDELELTGEIFASEPPPAPVTTSREAR